MKNEEVVRLLSQKGLHISFGESMTGGLCAACLIEIPDASRVLSESYVTYSEEAKTRLLQVLPETIRRFGVVSKEVAEAMARGVCKLSGAEIGVSITGYAGPSGGDRFASVGTVCFGFCINGYVQTITKCFGSIGRNEVRQAAAEFVFDTLAVLLS